MRNLKQFMEIALFCVYLVFPIHFFISCNEMELDVPSGEAKEAMSTPVKKSSEVAYCKSNKKDALAFFIRLYFIDNEDNVAKAVSHFMFCDIFSEYASEIEKIKKDWKNSQYNEKGAYIAPMPEMFLKKFAQNLIYKLI